MKKQSDFSVPMVHDLAETIELFAALLNADGRLIREIPFPVCLCRLARHFDTDPWDLLAMQLDKRLQASKKKKVDLSNLKTIQSLETMPYEKQTDFWDTTVTGFGLRVSRSGRKSWIAFKRIDGRTKRTTFGTFPKMRPEVARKKAKELLKET